MYKKKKKKKKERKKKYREKYLELTLLEFAGDSRILIPSWR